MPPPNLPPPADCLHHTTLEWGEEQHGGPQPPSRGPSHRGQGPGQVGPGGRVDTAAGRKEPGPGGGQDTGVQEPAVWVLR